MLALNNVTTSTDVVHWPHLAGLGVVILVTTIVVFAGRRARKQPEPARGFDRALGSMAIGVWTVIAIWYLLPDNLDIARSLPLHVCDLTGLIAPIAILYPSRRTRSILFFWGFALCTQALITPTIGTSPAGAEFWCFWMLHAEILALATFDFLVRGFRPTGRDLRFVVAFGVLYLAVMIPTNLVLDANYAYVGRHETSTTTILSCLGPWPWRILPVCLLAFVAHLLVFAVARIAPAPRNR